METWLPSSDYPGVTVERLIVVGDLVRQVRSEAVDDHRPDKFETNWSLGVRQYERTEGAITWASASTDYPWLTVVSGASGGASQYVFAIGGHPIRFCRGDEEEIAARYQAPCFPELDQRRTLFGPDTLTGRWLRLVITNTADGRPDAIRLMEVDGETGEPLRAFLIPRVSSSSTIADFTPPPVKPVDIPPVAAEPADDVEDERQKDQKKTGSSDE